MTDFKVDEEVGMHATKAWRETTMHIACTFAIHNLQMSYEGIRRVKSKSKSGDISLFL